MYAPHDSTDVSQSEQVADPSASGLAGRWVRGRRRITPWAYPRLRSLAAVRLTVGIVLVVVATLLITQDHDKWAVIPLMGAVLAIAIGSMDAIAARAARPRG